MSVRRLWVPSLEQDRVDLAQEQARYLRDVLRARVGDRVEIFDGEGARRVALIESLERRRARVRCEGPVVADGPAAGPKVTLLVSILKAPAMDRVVRAVSELGVAAIRPVAAARSVPAVRSERIAGRAERWRKIALEAARQSGRARAPEVAEPVSLGEALPTCADIEFRVFLHEEERSRTLAAVEASAADECILAVGPEGGWAPEEVGLFREAGFESRALSDAVLRADTAAIAAVAIVRRSAV